MRPQDLARAVIDKWLYERERFLEFRSDGNKTGEAACLARMKTLAALSQQLWKGTT